MLEELSNALVEHGFPIAAACACGYFVFLILKFILKNVMDNISDLKHIIIALDDRVDQMGNCLDKVDSKISKILKVNSNLEEK